MPTDELNINYMQRAIALAKKGGGFVHPNPLVGCVVVKNGEIIAEGYHERYGGFRASSFARRKLRRREWMSAPARSGPFMTPLSICFKPGSISARR